MTTVVVVRSDPSAESASALLPAALAGDRAAWDQIVRDHTRLLWWIARSHRLDDATSADVVQTVWLQLIRFGDRITDPSRLRGWLATTARREALRRTGVREVPVDTVYDSEDRLVAEPDERVIDDERLGAVLAAFEALPAKDQRLLRLMCDVPPKTYEEIAAILGRSAGHLGPTRQRALARLRALLSEQGAL
ncbi:MAG TPA: sigma-70 family RNA polymerase sigma factor [Ilumatobacter sp.]|nr:sigma-70 family RNA polymerase sigma factor [Ilumatobacter sp.]